MSNVLHDTPAIKVQQTVTKLYIHENYNGPLCLTPQSPTTVFRPKFDPMRYT